MNALPDDCAAELARPGTVPCVLLDGAMQLAVGECLAKRPGEALSLFDDLPKAAQALGPWLIPRPQALAVGVDGSARGVNWLSSRLPLESCAYHLRCWLRDGDPTGLQYTRLADGRVLCAAAEVWSAQQFSAFLAPFAGWWLADRDGCGRRLVRPPSQRDAEPAAGPGPGWTADQHLALAQIMAVDQLLHALKGRVRPCSALHLREQRYRIARQMQQLAIAHGYEDDADQLCWIASALVSGVCPETLQTHPAHARGLRGDALWQELMGAHEH